MHTLIIDDEPLARANVRLLLERVGDATVVGECASGLEALNFLQQQPVDLLFLDIQMPELNGFELLEQLPLSSLPRIVFVTAHDDFALRAFDYSAADYLLKPYTDQRFYQALERARRDLDLDRLRRLQAYYQEAQPYRQRLAVPHRGRLKLLSVEDILWLKSMENYVEVGTALQRYLLRITLKQLTERLDPARFVRIHRSAVINVQAIDTLESLTNGEYQLTLSDGQHFRLSRTYRESLALILDN